MPLDPRLRRINAEALQRLHDAWSSKRLTVVVGAGASVQSRLPSWRSLLERMLGEWIEHTHGPDFPGAHLDSLQEFLREHVLTESPITIAHYLRAHLSKKEFLDLVHSGIYSALGGTPALPGPIAKSVARLGHNLASVVTFNFDDLIEKALEAEGVPCFGIWKPEQLGSIRGLPVYHPHGYLPQMLQAGEDYWIVFAEEDYHTQYGSALSWQNITLARTLLESTCLFVSTSVTDPNLRRMLDMMRREKPKSDHYFIWSRPVPDSITAEEALIYDVYRKMFEDAQGRLGLKPVWFYWRDLPCRWDDIPELIDAVRTP